MIRGQNRTARRFRPDMEQLEDRTVPTLLGHQLYPADHAWNQRITDAPVAANSDAIIGNILSEYGNGRLHPDFTQNIGAHATLFGIPYNVVHGNSTPLVSVAIDAYPGESDLQPAPIPANAVLENDWQDGPRDGVGNRGDSHLLVFDVDNNVAYEFFRASRPSENADGKWHANQQTVWNMNSNSFRTIGYTSADAAGLSVLAGLTRPDEALPVEQGGQGVINHAIRVTMEADIIREMFLYPASHTANPGNNNAHQIPMGGRLRLRADVDITHLLPQSRIIAQAMKDYGLIVADNGSNFFFSGASSSVDADNQTTLTWNDADIQDWDHGLMSLTYNDFEVVDLTPRVLGLDVHDGEGGTVVTITGQNFAGASGHLQVWFGNHAASSVTYLDDAHLRVIAPTGGGAVAVTVQSGINYSSTRNYVEGVFGYGRSQVNADAQFTYPTPPNAEPTLAEAAAAAPAVVKAYAANLSALGADDGGEGNLTYSWSVVSKPAGVPDPSFQVNGSNAAKNTTVGFYQTGSYTLQVTIADADGLTATSNVVVTVVPALSFIIIVPVNKRITVGKSVKFFAYGLDQYGYLLSHQPKFTWKLIGQGTLTAAGRYTAPSRKAGPSTIIAKAGGLHNSTKITIVSGVPKTTLARAALLVGQE